MVHELMASWFMMFSCKYVKSWIYSAK